MSGTDERLNGLLDGELSPVETADTARALRDDPALTARLADLARVRAAITAVDADIAAPTITTGSNQRPWRREWALAGGAALVLLAAAVMFILLPARESPVLAVHRHFLAAAADAADRAELPDLSAAGLRLERVEAVGAGTYAGYVGPRGCRLGLWIGPRGSAPADEGGEWRIETVVQADGRVAWIAAEPAMSADRFAALAEAVRMGPTASTTLLAGAAARSACLS